MIKNFKRDKFNNDAVAVCFLIFAVSVLFLPAISGWQGIFRDDLATEMFPQRYFIADNLKHGIIPLWNPHIWCGWIPYYARYYSLLYHVFNWPFYLCADLGNINQAYTVIYILPWLLHLIFAATGAYILLRRILKCGYIAACFGALAYIYSPCFIKL
jgi:hypothetical protein